MELNIKEVKKQNKNLKHFRDVVRDYNKKTGFNFKLPDDTDYDSQYAHPIHTDERVEIRGQIDNDSLDIYGFQMNIDGVNIYGTKTINEEQLNKVFSSDIFNIRLGNLKLLKRLSEELEDKVNNISQDILSNVLSDIEKEDSYDLAIRTAKILYKS